MNEFVSRLQLEYDELKDKLFKLNNFLSSEAFSGLSSHQRFLLSTQHSIMDAYRRILKERLIDLKTNK